MLEEWCLAGYNPEDFWIQTPRTYHHAINAAVVRERINYNQRIELAWTTAVFYRTEKLALLEKYQIPLHEGIDSKESNVDDGLEQWATFLKVINGVKE